MEISVIASGSNGNCCMVQDKGTSILVDAGLSGKKIQERADALGKNIEDVKAIIITHSHSDHLRGAGVLNRRFNIPVYMAKQTKSESSIGNAEIKMFNPEKKFKIGGIEIKPIKTSHNVHSCGFSFNKKFGIMTDTGKATKQMEDAVKNLKAVLLESNHDIDMLIRGPYPYFLKQWIMGSDGHLSNIDASHLVQNNSKNLDLVILGHLSGHNNTSEVALSTFNALVKKKIEAFVADRDKETGNFEV